MKYIRTKDGRIVNVSLMREFETDDDNGKRIFDGYEDKDGTYYPVENIIKQADTIEELSDAYVIVPKDKKFKPYTLDTLSGFDDIEAVLEHNDIYSSIWVNALLKPVAKMNEIGDLCLI